MTFDPNRALFGRTYQISFEQPAAGRALRFTAPSRPALAGDLVSQQAVDNALQLTFEVDKKAKARSNKARITVVNLGPQNVDFIQEPGTRVRLLAGYRNNAEVIFVGDIATKGVTTDFTGPDRVTEIEAADAGPQIETTRFSRSFAEGTTARQVANAIVDQMGLPRGNLDDPAFAELDELSWSTGVAFFSPARDALSEVLSFVGATWSGQDGVLQVLRPGETTRERAVLLSPTTGLIGAPRRQKKGLEVTSFLQPQIRPGRALEIRSPDINGFYRVTQCQHRGDFRGSEWITTASCVELGGPR
jgi:hypothetical protein